MPRFTNSNVFTARSNRFSEKGPTFKQLNISNIDLGSGFESKNDIQDYFTNFLNSNEQVNYARMHSLYNQILKNDTSFVDKEYVCDELYDNGKVVERLIAIINYNSNQNFTKKDIEHIFKLKSKNSKKLHIYISLVADQAELVLIDLYHLSIPADIRDKRGKLIIRGSLDGTQKAYKKFESYRFNLNNILNEVQN